MANITLIMGESGTGKSTSIRTLDPKETFIINVLDKPLPFKAFRKDYSSVTKDGGNYFSSDRCEPIKNSIKYVNEERKDIKVVIIDDFQYVMSNEFMRKAEVKGYEKFTEIGRNAWDIIYKCSASREDLYFFILSHTETSDNGKIKCKTIGKMLDDKICLEGMFTTVLHSIITDGKYKFMTQGNGNYIAKSPMDMFDSLMIDNDLLAIKNKMVAYFGDQYL